MFAYREEVPRIKTIVDKKVLPKSIVDLACCLKRSWTW